MKLGKSQTRRVVAVLCAASWSGVALAGGLTASSSQDASTAVASGDSALVHARNVVQVEDSATFTSRASSQGSTGATESSAQKDTTSSGTSDDSSKYNIFHPFQKLPIELRNKVRLL